MCLFGRGRTFHHVVGCESSTPFASNLYFCGHRVSVADRLAVTSTKSAPKAIARRCWLLRNHWEVFAQIRVSEKGSVEESAL